MIRNLWFIKSNLSYTLYFRITINAKEVDLRKARTNSFSANVQNDFLIKSSLEANFLDIKTNGDFKVTKKLGVPTHGVIKSDGNINIGAVYGPTSNVGDILVEHDQTLKNLKEHCINIVKESKGSIEIGSSHGWLNIDAQNSNLTLNDISNQAIYVTAKTIDAVVKDVENFAYLKANDKIELLIDENLLGIRIYLKQQDQEVGHEDIEVDGYIVLDIADDSKITIEYLSSFQILKRKIEAKVYNKRN